MRPLALAALAAILCLSALGASTEDRWKGVRIYKKVKKAKDDHPLRAVFGGPGTLYEVEYTDDFKRCLAADPDLNRHRRGHGQGGGAPAGGACARAGEPAPAPEAVSPETWVQPAWLPRTDGFSWSAGYDASREAFVATTVFPQGATLGWKLADATGDPFSLTWAPKNKYMDEMLEFTNRYGVTSPFVYENAIRFDQESGCFLVGAWNQVMPTDDWVRGTYRFRMMYLHSLESDHPGSEGQPGYEKWQPVYDWRDGVFYECVIVTP